MAAKEEASQREEAEPNTLKDKWGEERPWDPERYPEGSPAREGHITKPSGQGGSSPKSRPDHQDMFPANGEPDAATLEYGDRLRRKEQGEDVDLLEPLAPVEKKAKSSKSESAADREARTARNVGSSK